MLALGASDAAAQQRAASGARISFPSQANLFSWERGHGFKRGFGGVFVVEQQVPVIVEREAPPPPAAVPSGRVEPSGGRSASGHSEQAQGGAKAPPRKPYVIGSTYASLPGGCMKLIDGGVSYYYCDGEWYRQVGDANYRAIKRKL